MQKTVSDTKQSMAVNADRSARRNNLVIYNFPEDDKDSKSKDKEFINELVNYFVHSANDYDLGKVAAWYGENYLSLNVKQTVDMIFHNSRKKLCLGDLSTSVAGSLIFRVGFYRFLGLIVDEHLSFKLHIHHFISKISSNIGRISRTRR